MELILLGTGCPSVDLDRHGPANLVDGGPGGRILVDCGSGVCRQLLAAGCPGADIDAVLLTHLHSDHIVDLFQLIISSWHQGRDRPQRVFGPPGTKRFVDGLLELWKPELEQRVKHEQRPSAEALKVEVTEIAAGDMLSFGEVAVLVVGVDHRPVRHAFGFVFEAAAGRLAISGDTAYCPALIEAAANVDILVHEVLIDHELPVIEGRRSAATVAAMRVYHTVAGQVGKVAAESGVKKLVLTHFVPPRFDRQALLDRVRRDYDGPVIIGEDLMRLAVSP